ncbi:MAG: diguanylate cyclase [Acaryochloridaceae cyanobacterium SU_2_1]|nr:diguanylate cyclase [Acaryochloridaceae cyanobacterium SU_2_1]
MNSNAWNKILPSYKPSPALHPIEQDLFTVKALTQAVLQSIGDAVITVNAQGRIRHLNPVAETLTGWQCEEIYNLPASQVIKLVEDRTHPWPTNWLQTILRKASQASLDHPSQSDPAQTPSKTALLIDRQGHYSAIEPVVTPLRDRTGQVQGAVIVLRDATAPNGESTHFWQANYDPLTGLANRYSFEQILSQALHAAQQNHEQHVLCHLNLDQFRVINDTYGHAAGDALLRQIIPLLQHPVRISDTLARLEGG